MSLENMMNKLSVGEPSADDVPTESVYVPVTESTLKDSRHRLNWARIQAHYVILVNKCNGYHDAFHYYVGETVEETQRNREAALALAEKEMRTRLVAQTAALAADNSRVGRSTLHAMHVGKRITADCARRAQVEVGRAAAAGLLAQSMKSAAGRLRSACAVDSAAIRAIREAEEEE